MNPVVINSDNIQQFGFKSTFDLLAQSLTFDISTLTTFKSSGADNVAGIAFSVIDPSGMELAGIDWTAPSIDPATASTFEVDLVNGFAVFGWYTITGQIKDQDGTITTIIIKKQICQPDGFNEKGYVPGTFQLNADCNAPSITVNETTAFVYNGLAPMQAVTKSGVFTYPPNTLSDLGFTATPFKISGSGNVYTGRYTINNTTVALYDLGDSVEVAISYVLTQFEQVVSCTTYLSSILCCFSDLQAIVDNDPYSANGKAASDKISRATPKLFIALIKEKAGQDNSAEVATVSDILGCDCDCSSQALENRPISGGDAINELSIVGNNAADVSSSVIGDTTRYTINVKNVVVANPDNQTGFDITRVENGNSITYNIILNLPALASAILSTIAEDQGLTEILQAIVGATGSNISLDGLDGGCIISLSNCSYSLIEPTNTSKTIISINIGGTVYNAPSSLLLTNTAGINTWLNGLDLGEFTASRDIQAGTVTISSPTNPNPVTAFVMSTGSGPLNRLFSQSCVGLIDFLNAIVTYICEIEANAVQFGISGKNICNFNEDGTVATTEVDPSTGLGTLIGAMLTAQCQLFNAINGIAINCANMKALYVVATPQQLASLIATDGVLANVNDACAKVKFADLATILLAAISGDSSLKTAFCTLVAGCTGATCSPPTSVSGVVSTGPTCVPVTNISGSVS